MFTLDTNILINLQRHYPRDVFTTLWEKLETDAETGRVCICAKVLDELAVGGDEVFEWARDCPNFTCKITLEELEISASISKQYSKWVQQTKNEADPFIIAHAVDTGKHIVTNETRAGEGVQSQNQKIPNVAEAFGVKTFELFDWLRHEKWTF